MTLRTRLESTYVSYGSKLSETSQGLIEADQEDEIHSGTDLANIWGALSLFSGRWPAKLISEKITMQFLWYKCVNALMGTSPVVDRSAVANSRSEVDLMDLMDRGGLLEGDYAASEGSSAPSGTREATDEVEDAQLLDKSHSLQSRLDTPQSMNDVCVCVHSERLALTPKPGRPKRRGDFMDQLVAFTEAERQNCLKLYNAKQLQRTERERAQRPLLFLDWSHQMGGNHN